MFVSLAIVVIYFLPYLQFPGIDSSALLVGMPSLIAATLSLITAFVLYLWAPSKQIALYTFAVYGLLVIAAATLCFSSGGASSPFIALWILVIVFAGIFGWMGYSAVLLPIIGYLIFSVINDATLSTIISTCFASLLPLALSFIIWHKKGSGNKADSQYSQLASELSHESNKADVVIHAISDGVVAINSQGVIQLINPAAQEIIGWGSNDALNLSYKSVLKLLDKADKPLTTANDPVESVLANNQQIHSEDFTLLTESGKKVFISLIVSPIGQPGSGAIMVFRDMTKEKAEEREQAEFISTASHEMRTPVASIEGYLGLVLNPSITQIDEKARDYVTKAQASAQHLGRLFQDLLDVSKAEDGRMTNMPTVIDVTEYVATIAEGLAPQASQKGLRFMFKPRMDGEETNERRIAPVYYAHVDADHLRELASNLIENAIKYTLSGDVIIDVGGDDSLVTISIQDSGVGIPAEDIPHLFQKFYRVDSTDTREIGGTGLGLYLSRRLAELMGGKIRLESEYKKGSTFYIDLPRLDVNEARRLLDASIVKIESRQGQGQELLQFGDGPPAMVPAQQPVQAQPIYAAPTPLPTADTTELVQTLMPTPAVMPEPIVQPQPIMQSPPPQQQPAQTQPQPTNTPLSQIEQNPQAYTRQPNVQIPNRQPGEINQP